MPVVRKSVALCIVLSLVTCGIYLLYWLYCLAEDVNRVCDRPEAASGGLVLLLSIVTCGIYELFWLYQSGEALDRRQREEGGYPGHLGLLYLLLAIFSLGIVSFALMQAELNQYAA